MNFKENKFKIFMILLCFIIFLLQINYSVSLFINGIDMKNAIELDKLNIVYESHPNLLGTRIIKALMQTHSLNVDVLSGFMVFFLIIGTLNFVDLFYFGLCLILFYQFKIRKNTAHGIIFYCSLIRLALFIVLIVAGGLSVLSVFLVGNVSVKEMVELGSFIIPIFSIFFIIMSVVCFAIFIKLEFRKS